MPPVLGPVSPSPMRLWSWLEASASTFLPSTMTMKLASSPSRNSSMTTRAPASPSLLPDSMSSMAACASARRHGDDDALAGSQAVGLDDDGRALLVDVGMCCGRLGKSGEFRGRDVVAGHEVLGEILRGFELRGFLGRAENLQAAGAEDVDHAGGERRFRADDGEVDLVLLGEISQGFRVGDVDVFQLVLARRAGVAGGDENLLQAGRLRQAPGHGVLAAAGTDDEEFHG